MPETPTKEGQNIIIKNLQGIFTTILGLSLALLFAWAQGLSKDVAENKVVIQHLKDVVNDLQNQINDTNGDVIVLRQREETDHDDSKIKLTRLEDWQLFHSNIK